MTAVEASRFMGGVNPSTIRQWVHRGLLPVAGRRGRANLFNAADLKAAQRAANRHNARMKKISPRRELPREGFDALVTVTEAARFTGISRSTLSSWVRRGRLRSAGSQGRTRLYRLRDVYQLVRGNTPPPPGMTSLYWDEEDA